MGTPFIKAMKNASRGHTAWPVWRAPRCEPRMTRGTTASNRVPCFTEKMGSWRRGDKRQHIISRDKVLLAKRTKLKLLSEWPGQQSSSTLDQALDQCSWNWNRQGDLLFFHLSGERSSGLSEQKSDLITTAGSQVPPWIPDLSHFTELLE